MKKIKIWDVPLRVFHWLFAVSITASLVIAFGVDEESPAFRYHMLFGLAACFSLLFRIVIGLAGARHARFRGLLFSPAETVRYAARSILGGADRYAGHNPGTAVVALLMFASIIGLAWTGLAMADDSGEEVHELLAYAMLFAVGLHLCGLILHTIRYRENIAISMITGNKEADPGSALPSTQPAFGLIMLVLCLVWSAMMFRSYDAGFATVMVPGYGKVSLGEPGDEHEGSGQHRDEDDDEDD